MDAAKKGQDALAAGDIAEAVRYYNTAISQNPQAVDYYIKRSTAYTRSKPPDHGHALSDAETAVMLAHKRAKRESIAQAQLRRAIAFYSLERYGDANECFKWAEKMNPQEKALLIWKMKVEDKMKSLAADDERLKINAVEIPHIDMNRVTAAARETAKANASGSTPATSAMAGSSATTADIAPVPPAFTPANRIRHDWYQNDDTVTISLMAKGVPADKTSVGIHSSSLSVSFPLPTGSDYNFFLEPLFAQIVPEESSYKIKSTKVDFILKKARAGEKWTALEGTQPSPARSGEGSESVSHVAQNIVSVPQPAATGPVYPTSSRSGPKDWDKLANELTSKKEKDKDKDKDQSGAADNDDYDDEGGDPVNSFFQKLYKGADPDTRRAMMKSYQESNGTALSTNWQEVAKKHYDTTPPDGMEAKKWGE